MNPKIINAFEGMVGLESFGKNQVRCAADNLHRVVVASSKWTVRDVDIGKVAKIVKKYTDPRVVEFMQDLVDMLESESESEERLGIIRKEYTRYMQEVVNKK